MCFMCRKVLADELDVKYFVEGQLPVREFLAERVTLWQTTPFETERWTLVKQYKLAT